MRASSRVKKSLDTTTPPDTSNHHRNHRTPGMDTEYRKLTVLMYMLFEEYLIVAIYTVNKDIVTTTHNILARYFMNFYVRSNMIEW